MRNYDYEAAKKFIQMHADQIETASLGMSGDWFWTAETVFEEGKFTVDLDDPELAIGGIKGSFWATPILEVEKKDGTVVTRECFTGEADQDHPPAWFVLGPLSGPVERIREERYLDGPALGQKAITYTTEDSDDET